MQNSILPGGQGPNKPHPRVTVDFVPTGLIVALAITATWSQGAFALKHWGPVAILALVVLGANLAVGGPPRLGRGATVALVALWAFAAWTLLSIAWAESPGRAAEGACRTILYASLFTVVLVTVARERTAAQLGVALMAGVGGIALLTLIRLLSDGESLFLAGRLDDPVGYRNATACLFAFAFWPYVAAAARREIPTAARALSFGMAALLLGLAFLTEARGVVLGLAVGAVVALAAGPDRLRRAWVATIAFGGLAIASGALLEPYDAFVDRGRTTPGEISTAAEALLALTLAAVVVGAVLALLDGGMRIQGQARLNLRRLAAAALVGTTVAAVAAGLVIVGNPVDFVGDRVDEFRSLETSAPGDTRLTFAGGQRSDLWRVALIEFRDHPVAGVGEGGYPVGYYLERRTDRNLSSPHSLAFSILAELGLVGVLLFAGFLAGVGVACRRAWRAAPDSARWLASGLGAGSAVVFAQSTVDWLWLIPGIIALGFLSLGLALVLLRGDARVESVGRVGRAAGAVAAVAAALFVGAIYVSDVETRRARVATTAESRLDEARTAERLNAWSLPARYLQARALEELDRRPEARRELRSALDLEPRNFVTLGLMGDLELRAGRSRAARALYRRALRLNPRDDGLRKLASR